MRSQLMQCRIALQNDLLSINRDNASIYTITLKAQANSASMQRRSRMQTGPRQPAEQLVSLRPSINLPDIPFTLQGWPDRPPV